MITKAYKIIQALRRALQRKGQFAGVAWQRPLKVRKAFAGWAVTKSVRCCVRLGLSHEEREVVQQARQSGELPAENQGLPWGEWLLFPYLIVHKAQVYIRLYPVKGAKPKALFKVSRPGKPDRLVSARVARFICLASEFSKVKEYGCMTLNVQHILKVR